MSRAKRVRKNRSWIKRLRDWNKTEEKPRNMKMFKKIMQPVKFQQLTQRTREAYERAKEQEEYYASKLAERVLDVEIYKKLTGW